MTAHTHGGSFNRIPHFGELYEHTERMEIEQPHTIVISRTPFLVQPDGSVYLGDRGPMKVATHLFKGCCILGPEVEIVRDKLMMGVYASDELTAIDRFSEKIHEDLTTCCELYDIELAEVLGQLHMLH